MHSCKQCCSQIPLLEKEIAQLQSQIAFLVERYEGKADELQKKADELNRRYKIFFRELRDLRASSKFEYGRYIKNPKSRIQRIRYGESEKRWKEIRKFPRRKTMPKKLAKDLERLEDES